MNTHTLSSLVAGLLVAAIGLSAALQERRRPTVKFFILFCLNLVVLYLADFMRLLLDNEVARWMGLAAASLVPVSAIKFFKEFLSSDPLLRQKVDRPVVAISAIFLLLLLYLSLLSDKRAMELYEGAIFAFVFMSLGLCLVHIYRKYQLSASDVEKTRLGYLLSSGAVALIAVLIAHLPWFRGVPSAIGKLVAIIYLYFISQMLVHYRLMDLQDVVARLAILASLILILTGVYSALVAWVDPDKPDLFFYNTLIASFVVLILVDPLKSTVEERVHRTLFRERYELNRQLDALRWRLSQVLELQPLFDELVHSLERTRRVTHAAIYISTLDGTAFQLAAHLGPRPTDRLEAVANRIFLDRLRMDGVLLQENLLRAREAQTMGWEEPKPEDQALDTVLRPMAAIKANVCFPLTAENRMLGIFAINDDRAREPYSPEEVEQFRTLANQIAVSIQNSRVFERMKERDRLAALGEMAAGLAHEIRNPLGAMKGAAQYLQEELMAHTDRFRRSSHKKTDATGGATEARTAAEVTMVSDNRDIHVTSEETGEFLEIIIEEANRLNRVVAQFLDYARPDRLEREPVRINEILSKTIPLLRPDSEKIEIRFEPAEDLPQVLGDPQQLHQVFLNLGLNAVQAMDGEGRLVISTFIRPSPWEDRAGEMVVVSLKDSGPGITPELLHRIFIPFVTTKKQGTGLGLPISHRIVESHGGRIEVDSRPGEGTTFRVVLPASDTSSITRTLRPA